MGRDSRVGQPADAHILQERLELLSATVRAFTEAVGDPQRLLETIAERTARALDAFCNFALVSDDRAWLVPAAFFAPDASRLEIIKQLAASAPLRIDSPHPVTRSLQ